MTSSIVFSMGGFTVSSLKATVKCEMASSDLAAISHYSANNISESWSGSKDEKVGEREGREELVQQNLSG